jgi:hypothetical protein
MFVFQPFNYRIKQDIRKNIADIMFLNIGELLLQMPERMPE